MKKNQRMKNGNKWAHDSSSKTIWKWMWCDRWTVYVALNVVAPRFQSVWNCEPVRLLVTQYMHVLWKKPSYSTVNTTHTQTHTFATSWTHSASSDVHTKEFLKNVHVMISMVSVSLDVLLSHNEHILTIKWRN